MADVESPNVMDTDVVRFPSYFSIMIFYCDEKSYNKSLSNLYFISRHISMRVSAAESR